MYTGRRLFSSKEDKQGGGRGGWEVWMENEARREMKTKRFRGTKQEKEGKEEERRIKSKEE
jgi:hypothetical protein